MESKTLKLIEKLNIKLGDYTSKDKTILYSTDGYLEYIVFPEQVLWDNDIDSKEFQKQTVLSRLYKTTQETRNSIKKMLKKEFNKFLVPRIEKIFPNVKFRLKPILNSTTYYELKIYGNYDQEDIDNFEDELIHDFENIFEGLRLSVKYVCEE